MKFLKAFSLLNGSDDKPLYYNVGIGFAFVFILLAAAAGEWLNAWLLIGLMIGFVLGNVVYQLGFERLSVHLGVSVMLGYQSLVLFLYREDANIGVIWIIAGPVIIARLGEPADILIWTPIHIVAIVIAYSYVAQHPVMQHPLSLPNLIGLLCLNAYVAYRFILERQSRERQLIQAANEAEAAEKRANRLLATLSHELRSPMSSILLSAEMLKDSGQASELDPEVVSNLRRSAALTTKVLNDVLELAKVEANLTELTRDTFLMSDLLMELRSSLEPLAAANGTRLLVLAYPECPSEWQSSETIIRQILNNLVSNAIKHTQDGVVVVDFLVRAESLEIQVVDSGGGILEEHQKEIFEPFITFADSAPEGTGLGLTLARDYAQRLGCELKLVDSKPGVGSTFSFLVPSSEYGTETFGDLYSMMGDRRSDFNLQAYNELHGRWMRAWCERWGISITASEDTSLTEAYDVQMLHELITGTESLPAARSIEEVRSDPARPFRPARCLVCDDNEMIRDVFAKLLNQQDCEVVTTGNIADTLQALETQSFDFMILDVQLGQESGVLLLEQLRASNLEQSSIPVCMMSGSLDGKEKADRVGADLYLLKPPNKEQLFQAVAHLLELAGRSDRL